MRGGLPLSVLLHVGAAYAVLHIWNPSDLDLLYVPAVPIEVITEAELGEILSVPEEVKVDEPAEEEPPVAPEEVDIPPAADPEPEPEPVTPEPKPDPVPPPQEEEKAPEPVPPQPDPEPKKEPPKPKVTEDDFFSGLEASLADLDPDKDDRRRPREISENAIGSDRNIDQIGEGRQLTITEETRFQSWMEKCWQPVIGTPDPQKLVVSLRIRFDITGEVQHVDVINSGEIDRSGDRYWQVSRSRAEAAVRECSPFEFLDPARYNTWQDVRMNFTPPY